MADAPRTASRKEKAPPPGDSVEIGKQPVDIEAKPHKKWLFLNYVAADCNLTEYQIKNLDQQELVGSDKNTHIAAFIDIGDKTNPFNEGWQDCRQYYITRDTTAGKLKSELIKEYGPTDMANPNTLRDFVVEATKRYPADHVALIFNDHGGGFTGAMSDDGSGGFMTVPQIRQALEEAEKITGKKIDIVGMDACLMGETEVAYELKDAARYLLASEESEGGPGWAYDSMLGGKTIGTAIQKVQEELKLGHRIDVGPEEFSKIVVDINREHSKDIPTFSATDLTRMEEVKVASDALAKAIKNSNDKDSIRAAIEKSENYGGGWLPYRDIRDAVDLGNKLIESSSDEKVKAAARAMIEAVNKAVLANENDPESHPESHGLSIYAPTSNASQVGYNYGDLNFARQTEWDEALISLYKPSSGGDDGSSQPVKDVPDVWPDGTPRTSKRREP
jgi:hypothetical protein